MSVQLSEEIKRALRDPETIKVLVTTGQDGIPHAVFEKWIEINSQGELEALTRLEFSRTNRNLVYSLWFHQLAAITFQTQDGRSYELQVRPTRCLITGKIFEAYYDKVRAKDSADDLASVWQLETEQIREGTYEVRREAEKAAHPVVCHLDQLVKE
ncbi:MAG: hypothetical protein ABF904_15250 [Ethanoligenens sp.]